MVSIRFSSVSYTQNNKNSPDHSLQHPPPIRFLLPPTVPLSLNATVLSIRIRAVTYSQIKKHTVTVLLYPASLIYSTPSYSIPQFYRTHRWWPSASLLSPARTPTFSRHLPISASSAPESGSGYGRIR